MSQEVEFVKADGDKIAGVIAKRSGVLSDVQRITNIDEHRFRV